MMRFKSLRAPLPPVERTIVFYRLFTQRDGDRIKRLRSSKICDAIRAANPALLNLPDADTALIPEISGDATDRFSIIRIKWRGHPDRFNSRTLRRSRLNLAADEGLGAATHFQFFSNNVLAAEINRDGPAPTSLLNYLYERGGDGWSSLRMKRIPNRATIDRLNRLVRLEKVRIRLSDETITHLHARNNTYVPILQEIAGLVEEGGVFEVNWKKFRGNGRLNAEALKALVLNILENDENLGTLDSKSQIELVGFDAQNREDTYVLSRDYVTSKQMIPRDIRGNISEEDGFAALQRGYTQAHIHFTEQLFMSKNE